MSGRVTTHLVEKAGKQFDWNLRREAGGVGIPQPRVIAISRQLGSGGRKVAEAVAGRLNWRLWDKEILNEVVRQTDLRYRPELFDLVDERAQGAIDAFAYSLMGDVNKYLYLRLLPKALASIARDDAVILGRGAHILLPEALRVRIVASMDRRIDNLARYEGLSREAALKKMKASDHEREAFLRDLTSQVRVKAPRVDTESQYDLVISMDRISVEQASDLILRLAREWFTWESTKRPLRHAGERVQVAG